MENSHLVRYINDHLAGSVTAIELLDRLIEEPPDAADREFLPMLRNEIEADQQVLKQLLNEVESSENLVRKAAGWLAEKAIGLKLRWDDPDNDGFRLFEALELLALGIWGKRALWRALATLSPMPPAIQRLDLEGLQQRADGQHAAVERRRLLAAREAFSESGAGRR
ncbi:MAG TPA: hypothetical protein VFM14_03785 [Gemmatimonadales bacterium]|nr:hypothetical protein [Gemmatimonadales bacterium]